jgi:sugar phosphate isomerase/epimerase
MTTPRWSLEQDLQRYADAGIPAIGVNWQKLNDDAVPTDVAQIRQSRLRVSSIGWCGGFTGAGQTYRDALFDGRRKLRVAGQIGASTLVVIPGPQSTHIRKHAARLTADALADLCEAAEGSSVQIGLQPMHDLFRGTWSFVHSIDESLAILDRVGDPRAKLCFGTYHLWQEPDLLRRAAEIVHRIASVQLSDWRDPPRCENDRLLPGDGCIPLVEIVEALESAGYRGWYEMEIWSRDLWKQDHVDLIDECVRRFDQFQSAGAAGLESPSNP